MISIDEAIKELNHQANICHTWGEETLKCSLRLGIEALKRIQEYRSMKIVSGGWNLPGETKK
ncbi:hypothetical protein ES708_19123 [subsurface metagenome]